MRLPRRQKVSISKLRPNARAPPSESSVALYLPTFDDGPLSNHPRKPKRPPTTRETTTGRRATTHKHDLRCRFRATDTKGRTPSGCPTQIFPRDIVDGRDGGSEPDRRRRRGPADALAQPAPPIGIPGGADQRHLPPACAQRLCARDQGYCSPPVSPVNPSFPRQPT